MNPAPSTPAHFTCHVESRYLPEQSSVAEQVYAFAYTVKIRNTGPVTAQLVAREWTIIDSNGRTDEVRGLAVVGNQPLLKPGETFEYSSWTRIATSRGRMQGRFFCISEDAHWFEAPVPAFELSHAQALH
jgi:ApaG protein